MACMCGDICCPSCGPAQGNWRCPLCRAWASEGCEHLEVYCSTCKIALDPYLYRDGHDRHSHETTVRIKPEVSGTGRAGRGDGGSRHCGGPGP